MPEELRSSQSSMREYVKRRGVFRIILRSLQAEALRWEDRASVNLAHCMEDEVEAKTLRVSEMNVCQLVKRYQEKDY